MAMLKYYLLAVNTRPPDGVVSALRASVNDLDLDLGYNTPWVNMSPHAKFGLDQPSRSAGHRQHTDRQTDR